MSAPKHGTNISLLNAGHVRLPPETLTRALRERESVRPGSSGSRTVPANRGQKATLCLSHFLVCCGRTPPRRGGSVYPRRFFQAQASSMPWQRRSLWMDGPWLRKYHLPAKKSGCTRALTEDGRRSHFDGAEVRTAVVHLRTLRRRRCTVPSRRFPQSHEMTNTTREQRRRRAGRAPVEAHGCGRIPGTRSRTPSNHLPASQP